MEQVIKSLENLKEELSDKIIISKEKNWPPKRKNCNYKTKLLRK